MYCIKLHTASGFEHGYRSAGVRHVCPVTNIEKCECRETQRNHSHRCGIPLRLSLQYIFLEEISASIIAKWSTTVGQMHVQRVSGGMLTSRGRCDFGNLHQKPLWSRLPSSQSISPLPLRVRHQCCRYVAITRRPVGPKVIS